MKILIAGLGSIGRRHLRNLIALGEKDIILYRTGKSTLDDAELAAFETYIDLNEALTQKPEGVIISNPSALHMDVALPAARAGANLLIEKPVSDTLDGLDELQETLDAHGKRAMTGFHFRYHPVLQDIKRIIQDQTLGKVLYARAHWGEYLPDWHPWEDYRQTYAARADLGGGVVNTLSHPFDYLRWLLGEVESLSAQLAHLSALELNVEDHADVSLKFASGVMASVHLDYYQKPPSHTLDISFEKGRILWDNATSSALLHYADGRPSERLLAPEDFERNTMFLEEMRAFLSLCRGETLDYRSLQDGIRAQQIVEAVKCSSAADCMRMPLEW
ncbi:MAG TPA: Gfo/Idh/MocA family oxidoreductase [Anaerolineaceae bacterium]|nr:Gfo/Idh/MocA family oxidoreductase [Anaerolineaceae bacterium]